VQSADLAVVHLLSLVFSFATRAPVVPPAVTMPKGRAAAALQGGGAHVPQSFLRGTPSIRPMRSLPSVRIRERIVLDDDDDDEPPGSNSTQPCRRNSAAAKSSSSQCASASGASVPGGPSVFGGAPSSRVLPAKGAAVWYVKRNERLESTVEAVHYDDTPPYYTVRFANGELRETTLEHLQERSGGGGGGGGRSRGCVGGDGSGGGGGGRGRGRGCGGGGDGCAAASAASAAVASCGREEEEEEVQVVGVRSREEKDRRLREAAIHLDDSPGGSPRKRRRLAAAAAAAASTSTTGLPRGSSGWRQVAAAAAVAGECGACRH